MSLRVCLVDDHPLVRDSLALYLGDFGWEVTVAECGAEGIEAIERLCPDVVVTDWHMPRASGGELIPIIRARFPNLPIIVISGGSTVDEPVDADTVMRLGADGYLAKPFKPRDLFAKIESTRSRARG